jgi:ankyrin repeat protein
VRSQFTPLAYSGQLGHLAMVKLLIENGCELHGRIRNSKESDVELLLKEQTDANLKDVIHGLTPLMWTCLRGHVFVGHLQGGSALQLRETVNDSTIYLSLAHLAWRAV